jgi:hypothetical protein
MDSVGVVFARVDPQHRQHPHRAPPNVLATSPLFLGRRWNPSILLSKLRTEKKNVNMNARSMHTNSVNTNTPP